MRRSSWSLKSNGQDTRRARSLKKACRMTALLNGAYGRIKDAPLRYGHAEGASPNGPQASGETEPSGWSRSEYVPRDASHEASEYYKILERARQDGASDDARRSFDWLGFLVRFVCGALLGVILSFKVIVDVYERPKFMHLAVISTIVFCAFASGFGGDAFWRLIRPWRWWW